MARLLMQALFPAWFMISDIFVKRFDKNISTPDKKFQIVFIFQLMINKSRNLQLVGWVTLHNIIYADIPEPLCETK